MILAGQISRDDFAAYAFFVMTINLFATYATLGIGVSASQYFAIARKGGKQKYGIKAVLQIYIIFTIISLLLLTIIPQELISGRTDLPRSLLIIGVVSFALDAVPGGAAMGLERYRSLAWIALLYLCVALLGIATAAYYNSYLAAIWVWIGAATIRALGSVLVIYRQRALWSGAPSNANGAGKFSAVTFIGPLAIVSISSGTGLWLGGWLHLNIASDPNQYPQYAIGLQWFALGLFIPQLVSQTIIPRLAGQQIQTTNEDKLYLRRAIKLSFTAALIMCSCGAAASFLIAPIYGEIFDDQWFIIAAFGLAAVPYAIINTIGNALVAKGDQWAWLGTSLVYQIIFLTLSYWWIEAGAASGAVAIAISGSLQSILVLGRARQIHII